MNKPKLVVKLGRLISDNSPLILTGLGVVGTITTAYLSAQAGFRAGAHVERTRSEMEIEGAIDTQEAHDLVYGKKWAFTNTWEFYIPAVTSAIITCGAIVVSNRIGTKRAAALAAAYTITENSFKEYRDKVIQKVGEKKEQEVRDEVAQDNVAKNAQSAQVLVSEGKVLCYDAFSGRYFDSTMETLKKAQNDTNYQVLNDVYASLGDFYSRVGLARTSISEEVGWNSNKLLELEFSTTMSEDGRPCISIGFHVDPVRNYHKVY